MYKQIRIFNASQNFAKKASVHGVQESSSNLFMLAFHRGNLPEHALKYRINILSVKRR